MIAPPDPSYLGLFFSFLPLLGCTIILAIRGLGQVRPMLIAVVRLCVQLSLLASILRWVFAHQSPVIVLGIAIVMLLFSAQTVDIPGIATTPAIIIMLITGVNEARTAA